MDDLYYIASLSGKQLLHEDGKFRPGRKDETPVFFSTYKQAESYAEKLYRPCQVKTATVEYTDDDEQTENP